MALFTKGNKDKNPATADNTVVDEVPSVDSSTATPSETPTTATPSETPSTGDTNEEITNTPNVDETPSQDKSAVVDETPSQDKPTVVDDEETEVVTKPEGRRQCKGLFTMMDVSDFTQNERYSDTYLKSKGLFKGN